MQSPRPQFVVFCGLPGTGKSTLSYVLAQEYGWVLLTKDAIDRSLEHNRITDGRVAYDLMLDLARLNLARGNSVILDAVFGTDNLRRQAAGVAREMKAQLRPIYCINSNERLWRQRLESRPAVVAGWTPADWAEVERVQRYFEPLADEDFLTLDSNQPLDLVKQQLLAYLGIR